MKTFLFALFLAGFLGVCALQPAHADSVADRVLDTETLKCGYAEWTPILFKDMATGDMQGMSRDIIDAIGHKLGVEVEWTENAGWGTLAEGLAAKRYDMICVTLGQITTRARVIDFSRPIFYLPVYPIVRADDARFDKNLDLLEKPSTKIGVLEGEASALLAAERFPKAATIAISQTSDYSLLMEDIKAKKSDISFITADTFDSFNKKQPGVFKIANHGTPISVIAAGFGLPTNDIQFKNLIDTAVAELQNEGTMDRLMDKYDPKRTIFLRPPTPYMLPKATGKD